MTDRTVFELAELQVADLVDDDVIYIGDTSAGGPRKIRRDNLAPALSQAEVEDDTGTKFGLVSGQRLSQAVAANVSSPLSEEFTSAAQTITAGGSLTLAHGLSAIPKLLYGYIICTTADLNYSIGDNVVLSLGVGAGVAVSEENVGIAAFPDATNVGIMFGVDGVAILNKTSGEYGLINTGRWQFYVRAWA